MKTILLALTFGLSILGCNKEDKKHPCYDISIVHNDGCLTYCPGFEGCDGKTYCNECEAARDGIGPK